MFTDYNAAVPLAMCPRCGKEIYGPGLEICRECQEREENKNACDEV